MEKKTRVTEVLLSTKEGKKRQDFVVNLGFVTKVQMKAIEDIH